MNGGNNQNGAAGSALPTNPSVVARDEAGTPVAGVTVFFAVLSGGGSVAQTSAVTNTQGIASSGTWTLGTSTGTQLMSAQVPQAGVNNNPLLFTATATAGAPASVTSASATQQSAPVGTLVSSVPSVIVRDASGNQASGVTVTFAVTSGGGQLTGVTQTTSLQGIATVGSWRVGAAPGTNTVTATVGNLASVTFTATGTAGAPSQIVKTAGDAQTASVNRPVTVAPQVRVIDAAGNGVPGVTVNFTVDQGGGSAVVSTVVTDAGGRAAVGAWIMGSTVGNNTLIASVSGLSSVTFTATAVGGAAASMQPISPVSQSGIAGTLSANPPAVAVRDAQGNAVAGVLVTFSVTAGAGSLVGATATTDVNGVAAVTSWTFGSVAGLNTVVATATGLANVIFNATTTGVPSLAVAFAGNNQAAVSGTSVATSPAVRVTDLNGQGAGGVQVTFVATNGGGVVVGGSQLTDATGVATIGSWILGPGAPNTLTATVTAGGVTGNPVTFTASSATQIAITQQPPANSPSATPFTVSVQLRDALGAASPVNNVPLTISIFSGPTGLNASGTALTVNTVSGVATFNVSLTGNGARTLRITGAGVGFTVTSTITIP